MKKIVVALDVEREIKYTINAMVDLENRFGGVPISAIFSASSIGITVIRALLLIGLTHGGAKFKGNPDEQEAIVGNLIQEHWLEKGRSVQELVKIVMEGFVEAGLLPPSEEDEDEDSIEAKPEEPENPTLDG